jgi:diphthamide synthase (EF-2-diphthine--ammonia ligase)
MGTRVILSWSGGKDSAMALYEIRRAGDFEIEGLLTTITQDYDRVCRHGVRTTLLEQPFGFIRFSRTSFIPARPKRRAREIFRLGPIA